MALVSLLWLLTPFVVIAVVSADEQLRGHVAENPRRCRITGGTGVVMMCVGAVLAPGLAGTLLYLVGTPLVGFIVWTRRDDGDDGGDEGPDVPPIDWDDFERSFWAQVRNSSRGPRHPRAPSAH
jgi:hypothetical protein